MANAPNSMPLPNDVAALLHALESRGYEANVVGGCVRSFLLGREIADYDIATNAKPHELQEIFVDYPQITAGLKHMTLGVYTNLRVCEITTYRCEGAYSDCRHPDSVTVASSLAEDAARRDFTMNAIYYSPTRGFSDPCGGIADIKAGVIRAVGSARARFSEDALRLLRALRFAACLNFEIAPETAKAIHDCRQSLSAVSSERIFEEFKKLVCGYRAAGVIREYVDVIGVFIPDLLLIKNLNQHNPHHIYDVLEHTLVALSHTPPLLVLRLSVLLHDIGKGVTLSIDENGIGHFYRHAHCGAQMADLILRSLRCDNEMRGEVVRIIKNHDAYMRAEKSAVRRFVNRFGVDGFRRLLIQKRVDGLAKAPGSERSALYDEIERLLGEILAEKDCCTLKELKINGDDLLALGVSRGRDIGEILGALLDEVLDGLLPNAEDSLKSRAVQLWDSITE